MQLKFHARGDLLVTVPGFAPVVGQPLPRVGRDWASREAIPPATKEPFVVDSDTAEGRRLKKLIQRDGSLWAADKATADECGVTFVELELKDGAWTPKVAKSSNKGSE